MKEDTEIVDRGDPREHLIDDLGHRAAVGVERVQGSDVEHRSVTHAASSSRIFTGRSHCISTTQPVSLHTECSVPTGLTT